MRMTRTLPSREVHLAELGSTWNRIGSRAVAAVCEIRPEQYRLVWLNDRRGGGPPVFFASLNTDKWQPAISEFSWVDPLDDEDDAAPILRSVLGNTLEQGYERHDYGVHVHSCATCDPAVAPC